jgi:hypothetical protein
VRRQHRLATPRSPPGRVFSPAASLPLILDLILPFAFLSPTPLPPSRPPPPHTPPNQVVNGVRDLNVYIEQPCLTYEECLSVRKMCPVRSTPTPHHLLGSALPDDTASTHHIPSSLPFPSHHSRRRCRSCR